MADRAADREVDGIVFVVYEPEVSRVGRVVSEYLEELPLRMDRQRQERHTG